AQGVAATRRLPRGGVALVENTRFVPGEEENDPKLAATFAALGDFYVNDAFGSAHRAHASTEAIAHLLKPAVAGFLMEKELKYLGDALEHPKRPFVAVLGGAKISGKIDVIDALLPKCDEVLIGGAMACTFFAALGFEVGNACCRRSARRSGPEGRRDHRRRRRFGRGGRRPRGQVLPRLDGGRSVPGVPRRQGPARRRGPGGCVRQVVFAANWKMHLGPEEARAYLKTFFERSRLPDGRLPEGCEVWFFPPAVSLEAVAQALVGRSGFLAGAQNVYWEPKGAFTGEISAPLAAAAGARAVLVGHSERRHRFGEIDADTERKLSAVLEAQLLPLLCVGETLAEREAGNTLDVVTRQLEAALGRRPPAALQQVT